MVPLGRAASEFTGTLPDRPTQSGPARAEAFAITDIEPCVS